MKTWKWILALAIIAASIIGLWRLRHGTQSQQLTIGIQLPLSGDAKIYGDEMLNGIRLALNLQAQDSGSPRVSTVVEDDAGKSATALSAFTKLIDLDGVQVVIGGAMSSTAAPIVPVAKNSRVVLISPAASAPNLCSEGGYFFRVWPSDIYEATALADYAVEKLDARTAAVLYVNNDYGQGASSAFAAEFARKGGKVLLNEGYAQDSVEFRTVLTKIGSLKPAVLYVPGYYKELANLLRQASELGVKPQFLGGVGFQEQKILELAGAAAEGTVFTTPYYDADNPEPVMAKFRKAYQATYGDKPGIFAAHSYDATRVVLDALAHGARSGEEIRNHLLALNRFPGAAGSLTFTDTGDVVKRVAFHAVRNGAFVSLDIEQ